MAAIFGSAVRRTPRFITFLKNSATCFSMGTVACSNDSFPMSECRDSAIAKRLTDPVRPVRQRAALALAKVEDITSIPVLVEWSGTESSDTPAARIEATSGVGTSGSGGSGKTIAIIALVVGALGLLVGGAGLVAGRRPE